MNKVFSQVKKYWLTNLITFLVSLAVGAGIFCIVFFTRARSMIDAIDGATLGGLIVLLFGLLMMVAQVSDMKAGELMHVIADAHIYDRHVPLIEELISRKQFKAPKVTLDPTIKNFYDFTADSFKIEDYETGEQIKDIPIAI